LFANDDRQLKKFLIILVVAIGAYFALEQEEPAGNPSLSPAPTAAPVSADGRQEAESDGWRSGEQVHGRGTVSRLLSDDNDGSRHQRFILRPSTGRTLLIAHNIDLAPRLSSLRVGDSVSFYGVYEWNDRGGVIHWTHHDPRGRHPAGWLEHKGRRYQ